MDALSARGALAPDASRLLDARRSEAGARERERALEPLLDRTDEDLQALLLLLLVAPFPRPVQRFVVSLCDSVLFWQPHPNVPLSFFWVVLLLSVLTFVAVAQDMMELHAAYHSGAPKSERVLIKLLAEERNAWISGCCAALWVGLHRYRSLLKKLHAAHEQAALRNDPLHIGPFVPKPVPMPAGAATARGEDGTAPKPAAGKKDE